MRRHSFAIRRLFPSLLFTAGLLFGCSSSPGPEESVRSSEEALPTSPELRFGNDARPYLDSSRIALLDSLASASGQADIVLDATSKAVLQLQLAWNGGKPTARENALRFVEKYQALLDPRVSAGEYTVGQGPIDCGGSVVILDRTIGGKQVVGSRLTLHFDETGQLISVVNGVAPVPSTLRTVSDPTTLPGATPLYKLTGQAPVKGVVRVPVLVPMADGSGLFEGDLASWVDGGHPYAAVAIGYTAVSARLDAETEGDGRSSGTAPLVSAGSGTDVPSQVSYRNLGGVKVSFLNGERNPLESAYRFLEEHPTLFHTGSPRCQYLPAGFTENPTVPGVFTARLAQRHGPLPVFGADIVVRLEGFGTVQGVYARARGSIEVEPTPSISAGDAVNVVTNLLNDGASRDPTLKAEVNDALSHPATTRLGVLPGFRNDDPQLKDDRLVWKVDQGHFTLFIDARDGRVRTGVTGHPGRNIVKDAQRASEFSYPFYATAEIDGIPQSGAPSPPNADVSPGLPGGNMSSSMANLDAMYTRNGWSGLLGNGRGDFVASANVALATTSCPNAFFDSTFTNSAFFCAGMASVDVVGHELTHGVIAHSSGLIYADQSGAINEAYADLFGNLNQPPSGDWRIGENDTSGAIRDMMNPGLFGQPAHMSGYVPRSAACGPFPWSCDSGGVHTNSGILNRAHALLSDGLPGFVRGIGREKVERLAFFTMTQQLPSDATLNQVAGATRDTCEMFVARGITTRPSNLPFTMDDCDQVTNAFNQVGLNPSLSSGWSEPALGFFGTDVMNPDSPTGVPALTPGLCPVTNIVLAHQVPILGTSLFADYDPLTATPPRTRLLDFIAGTDYKLDVPPGPLGRPMPLDTPRLLHSVNWFSAYGIKPRFESSGVYASSCAPPPEVLRASATFDEGFESSTRFSFFGSSTRSFGNPTPASLNPSCTLVGSALELVDGSGRHIGDGPGPNVHHTITHWILFIPVNFTIRASIVTPPSGTNMSGTAALSWDLGRTVRTRWRYTFNLTSGTPPGTDCNPL